MILRPIWKSIESGLRRAALRRTRRELLALSDRTLADIGYSRVLLEEGLDAWPWHAPADDHDHRRVNTATTTPSGAGGKDVECAVEAFGAYTGAELSDLAIERVAIEDAVRQGSPGIDTDSRAA